MKVIDSYVLALFFEHFISHMVQMKGRACNQCCNRGNSLYPTWFRWKKDVVPPIPNNKDTLYPTWFRWKRGTRQADLWQQRLYIPHGSDERGKCIEIFFASHCFISHMVQMKACSAFCCRSKEDLYIPHGSDERMAGNPETLRLYTLYPTWFRWKRSFLNQASTPSCPLYPTWFRWKPSCRSSLRVSTSLYIPHGSDESKLRGLAETHKFLFISHMVQMKAKRDIPFPHWLSDLYIPHGSDERRKQEL